MPGYDYIKISTSSHPHFVRSQSFSHHHRPRQHIRVRCPDNCASVPAEDWSNLVERERNARSANDTLTRENRSLKSDLRAAVQENRRLQDRNQELQDTVEQLTRHHSRDDNITAKLRRRLADFKAEVNDKDHIIHELKKEKDLADIRVRELSHTVSCQATEITQLDDEVKALNHIHKKEQHELGVRTEKVKEAWSLIDDLRRQLSLHKCREHIPLRRRYGFA
jgi:chromosome segregation ATPase